MKVSTPSAYRMSAKIAATWDEVLPRGPRLLVPVQLDVLVVRQVGGTWARTAMQTPTTDDASNRELAAPPFAELDVPRPRGAYLHWAPPDALTHGRQREVEGGEVQTEFPALPDRWLVLRISAGATAHARAVTGWVLRAGDEVPVAVPLDEWRGTDIRRGAMEAPMTVLGHGDPAFVAYFDNVTNRLSFYDDMRDVRPGAVAYQVSGWFADTGLDPIATASVNSVAAFERRVDELGWRTPALDLAEPLLDTHRLHVAANAAGLKLGTAIAVESWPTQTLYHGSAVGIGWPQASDGGFTQEIGGPPSAAGIDIAIGATPGSAVATLVAKQSGASDREPIVEAYYAGALAELDQPDARARIDARLHRLEFGSIAAGETTTWIWQTDPPRPPRPQHFDVADVASTPTRTLARTTVATAPASHAGAFTVRSGGLSEVLAKTAPAAPSRDPDSGRWVQVRRALPRFFHPMEPVLLIAGAHRTERHGGDGRFTADGRLACRTTGGCVRRLQGRAPTSAAGGRALAVEGAQLLERRIDNGSVPPECEALLDELVLLDPGSARAAALAALGIVREDPRREPEVHRAARTLGVEQTVWWASRDLYVDGHAIADRSGLVGMLPSPLAVTPPRRPWQPVHVDWRVEFSPTSDRVRDWALDEIDLEPTIEASAGSPPIVVEGRSLLTDGVVRALSSRTRKTLATAGVIGTARLLAVGHEPSFASDIARELVEAASDLRLVDPDPSDDTREEDIADALADLDLLAGSFETLHESITAALGSAVPPMCAGWLRVLRLRLVDGFGQVVDLAGSNATTEVDPQRVLWSRQLRVEDSPGKGVVRPRCLEPARVLLRYVDGTGGPEDAGTYGSSAEQLRHVSPLCGFVLPNHLDASLAFFDAAGVHLGAVTPGLDAPMVWEDAPGRPTIVGQTPRDAIANPLLAAVAASLVAFAGIDDSGEESALAAMLRVIDSTRWAIDPFGDGGEDHTGLLVGHPIAVMRARLRIEIDDPQTPRDRAERERRARGLAPVPVRLGALSQLQDGLLGYFVDGDATRMHTPDPAVADFARPLGPDRGFLQRIDLVHGYSAAFADDLAGEATAGSSPVRHPFIDTSGVLWVQPERDVMLTLLMEPHSRLHVTTGMLPRKDIGMRRSWLDAGLSHLMPTFRFGPVLVDPQQVRMPVPRQVDGQWSWSHRAAIGRWENPAIVQATSDAGISDDPAIATEGWLRFEPPARATEEDR